MMVRRSLAALLALPLACVAQTSSASSTLEGAWLTTEANGSLHNLQLRFHRDSAGDWTCAVDVLDKNLIYNCTVVPAADSLTVTVPGFGASFSGTLAGNTLRGTWHGRSGDRPLSLHHEQTARTMQSPRHFDALAPTTKDDLLRGSYGPYRANNDLLHYHLSLRVDPVAETIRGTNDVRFRMLEDGTRIQLELTPELAVDAITMHGKPLHYTRDERTLWIDTAKPMHRGKIYSIVVAYSGHPARQGRFGCFSSDKDKNGKPWITTACEGEGPSLWWPNKDQWRDEPQNGMEIDVAVPTGLTDVSNGRFAGTKLLKDGYTVWKWKVSYPINNYDVALNIGDYTHFSGPKHGNTTLDFYVLPYDLAKARQQFGQVPTMLDAYEHFFGEYPFARDGYKLIEVPYAGMEHQSAVAYGNGFQNSYLGGDWTGVGISPRFDFIIIHESGHEWFGNAITASDRSDMWIHEGWTTYLECLYVEYRWGKADGLRYLNGYKTKVLNERPIIAPRGVNAEPPEDQYFKGALMLNTLRSQIGDDTRWFADIHDFFQQFKYRNIMTEDVVAWWNQRTGLDLTPFFDQYLRHAAIPTLELDFKTPGEVRYRWKADEPAFAMPVEVGDPQHWTRIAPVTSRWNSLPWQGAAASFAVATDLFYVNVARQGADTSAATSPSRDSGIPHPLP